jgi:pimeloyl-ACP methyl ester carboxylesterase
MGLNSFSVPILSLVRYILSSRSMNSDWHMFNEPFEPIARVVFVHGLFGDREKSWKQLAEFVSHDPELPSFKVASWGWTTGVLVGGGRDIHLEGRRLFTEIAAWQDSGLPLVLVGHSMGGLTVLNGLVEEMKTYERASDPPCCHVDHVVLYASPVAGSDIAKILGLPLRMARFGSAQLRQLMSSKYANELLRDVVNHIYHPEDVERSSRTKRKIPITAICGLNDKLVPAHSSAAIFSNPRPVEVNGDHEQCKVPDNRADSRYLTLKKILSGSFDRWFIDKCRKAMVVGDQFNHAERAQLEHHVKDLLRWRLDKLKNLRYSERSERIQNDMVQYLLDSVIQIVGSQTWGPDAIAVRIIDHTIWEVVAKFPWGKDS